MYVRRAVAGDAETIARVHVLTWQAGYRGLLPQSLLDGLRAEQRVPRWTETLGRAAWPHRGTLVADDAGAVVGFADLRPATDDDPHSAEVGEIASFYVLPAVWRQGVGRRLMTATVQTLATAGYTSAALWVLETNKVALEFYARLGWEPDGSMRDDVVGDTVVRDVRYRRSLY
jgi:GNAT superfamily N-acetyltransferase